MHWHRLRPWPDSAHGLHRLRHRFLLAPLSNGNTALLADLARYAGLPFDTIFGADVFQHYKPDPESYLGAARLLLERRRGDLADRDLLRERPRVGRPQRVEGAAHGREADDARGVGGREGGAWRGGGRRCWRAGCCSHGRRTNSSASTFERRPLADVIPWGFVTSTTGVCRMTCRFTLRRLTCTAVMFGTLLSAVATGARADGGDWPQWRGPKRDWRARRSP